MKALRVSALVAILAGPALAGDTARRPPEGELGAVSLWLYPLPTAFYAVAHSTGIVSLAAGGSVQPARNVVLTFEVAPAYTHVFDASLRGIRDFSVAGTYLRVGSRLMSTFEEASRAYFFIEPKLELVGFGTWSEQAPNFSLRQGAVFLGADVGVRFWPASRLYVALVAGASAGVCAGCSGTIYLPATIYQDFNPSLTLALNLNPNLLRVGWVF